MKTMFSVIFSVVATICANAQTVNALDSIDEQQRQKAIEVSQAFVKIIPIVDNDVEIEYDGNNTGGKIVSARPIFATHLLAYGKFAYQDGQGFPEFGAGIEQHTKHFIVSGKVGARYSRDTKYQEAEADKYWACNAELSAYFTIWKSKSKHTKVSLGGFCEFPLSGQRKHFEASSETYDFKYDNYYTGRRLTWGGSARIDFAPGFQKACTGYVQLNIGRGQNYEYNNDKKNQLYVSLTAAVTLKLQKTRR